MPYTLSVKEILNIYTREFPNGVFLARSDCFHVAMLAFTHENGSHINCEPPEGRDLDVLSRTQSPGGSTDPGILSGSLTSNYSFHLPVFITWWTMVTTQRKRRLVRAKYL